MSTQVDGWDFKYVEYHSREWDALVEQGWVTMTVDENNRALMTRKSEESK